MTDLVDRLARQSGLTANVVWVLVALALVLLAGSAVRGAWLLRTGVPREELRKRLGSLVVWWVLFALLVAVLLLGRAAAVVLFAAVSLLGLREYRTLAGPRVAPVWVWWRLAHLAVPLHYLLLYFGGGDLFWAFIPVWVFMTLAVRLVVTGQTASFLETAGITFLGLMLIVFLFSHAVLVLTLPDEVNPAGGAVGLFVFLVVLTEVNDIAQAQWGRWLGRRKITPTVSPNKTWEGFLLGAATTVALAVALAGFVTPFADLRAPVRIGQAEWSVPYLPALAVGVLIAVGGFFGDVTMSAIKREVGVKDSGDLLPGQGGVLDRIDSLTFTGPLFYHFTSLLYRGEP
jgi:phosphatidate cytidylyltransferase